MCVMCEYMCMCVECERVYIYECVWCLSVCVYVCMCVVCVYVYVNVV